MKSNLFQWPEAGGEDDDEGGGDVDARCVRGGMQLMDDDAWDGWMDGRGGPDASIDRLK